MPTPLHNAAREIFQFALAAVDARKATRLAIEAHQQQFKDQQIFVVSLGKAALSMAMGLTDALTQNINAGIVICPKSSNPSPLPNNWQLIFGGHPLPNEASLAAAKAVNTLLQQANAAKAVVIFLISGGGSAMMEWPASADITLSDLQQANQLMVTSGATIKEINVVRRAFSAVKGGGLIRNVEALTLIISDTNAGDESSVASGPTLMPPLDGPTPLEVISRYELQSVLPSSIVKAINDYRQLPHSGSNHSYKVILDNRKALEAAHSKARELGFKGFIAESIVEQPIQEGCELMLSELLSGSVDCVISGGEFSCPARGDGRGGRNLETVLRSAIVLDSIKPRENIVVLSAGTDGIDGNSTAAGAVADETTLEKARNRGLNAVDFLARSDSFTFFEQLEDLIVTGPTGTNVRDLRIFLKG